MTAYLYHGAATRDSPSYCTDTSLYELNILSDMTLISAPTASLTVILLRLQDRT
jgi:hypothetical protein